MSVSILEPPVLVPAADSHNAEDLIREMTHVVDRYVAQTKATVFQLKRRDRDFSLDNESALHRPRPLDLDPALPASVFTHYSHCYFIEKITQMKHAKKRVKETHEKVERGTAWSLWRE